MKRLLLFTVLLWDLFGASFARQNGPPDYGGGPDGPDPATTPVLGDFSPNQHGPNSTLWRRIIRHTNDLGDTIYHTNQYAELAIGLNYLVGDQTVPAKDIIVPTDTGSEATNGQHKVIFQANTSTPGVINLITPNNLPRSV